MLEPYRTDFKTAKDAKAAYFSGKLFKEGETLVTCRDFIDETVTIRYNRARRVTTATFNELDEARYSGEKNEQT